jgi:APA family basic amino acid/polyamine antiporter
MNTKKQLSLFDISMIVVSLVIGMGIFRTPVNVAQNAQIPELFYLAWIIGGLVSICGALTYAEIGSRFPVTGGYYKIFSICYHPSIAFAINCIIIISNAASVAGIALIGAEYLNNALFPPIWQTTEWKMGIAISSILIFYSINLLGLKTSSKTQNILTVIKLTLVLILSSSVFFGLQKDVITPIFTNATNTPVTWVDYGKALGLCLIAVSFTFGGYQQTINFGGETKNPNKVMPRAIILGLVIIISLYVVINLAYVNVIGFEQLKTAKSIAALLAENIFGKVGFTVLSVLIFFSVLGYVNVNLLSNPRAMYAMAEEKALPSFFAKTTKKHGVMVTSLTVFTVLSVFTLFYAKTFDEILNYVIFLDSFGMVFSASTIFFLRKKTAHLNPKDIYTMKLYPLLPLLFVSAYIFVSLSIFFDDPTAATNGMIIFVGFIVIYFLTKFMNKQKA